MRPFGNSASFLTGGIYHVQGRARDGDHDLLWSVILKILPETAAHAMPAGVRYWRREALCYASGLLDDLPGGVAAPRYLGGSDRPGEGVWLWLEDLGQAHDAPWSLAQYALVARHLGRFNGAYLTGHSLPRDPWLSTGWLRGWLALTADAMAQLPLLQDRPLVRRGYSPRAVAGITQLWDEREQFLSALDHLPQTFCHYDAFRRNLFLCHGPDGADRPTFIDWEFAGIGAIGAELAALVAASLIFYEVDLAQARALDELVTTAYGEGLREAGWQGDARLARFGYCAAAALRYGPDNVRSILPILADESLHARMEQFFGHTMEEITDHMAACVDILLDRADDARTLLRQLF